MRDSGKNTLSLYQKYCWEYSNKDSVQHIITNFRFQLKTTKEYYTEKELKELVRLGPP